MSSHIGALRIGLAALALLGTLTGVTRASEQSVTPEEIVRSVRRMLERLPYYGVFDLLSPAGAHTSATAKRRIPSRISRSRSGA